MDRDKAREAVDRAKRLENGTGDALAEGGSTGIIALGMALAANSGGEPQKLIGGIVIMLTGMAFYAIRRHYRDQRFS